MARICPGCQTQNIDGARFCRTCGTVLQPSSPTPPPSVVDQPPFQQQPYQSPTQYPPPYTPQYPPYQGGNPTSSYTPIPTTPNYGDPIQPYYPVQNQLQYPLAGFGSRFGAWFVDNLIATAIFLPGYLFAIAQQGSHGNPLAPILLLVSIGGYFAFLLFNTYLQGTSGATVGKKIFGLKVLDQNGQPLGFGKSILREIVKFVLANICIFIFLTMIWDSEKQALQDKVVSSHVYEA